MCKEENTNVPQVLQAVKKAQGGRNRKQCLSTKWSKLNFTFEILILWCCPLLCVCAHTCVYVCVYVCVVCMWCVCVVYMVVLSRQHLSVLCLVIIEAKRNFWWALNGLTNLPWVSSSLSAKDPLFHVDCHEIWHTGHCCTDSIIQYFLSLALPHFSLMMTSCLTTLTILPILTILTTPTHTPAHHLTFRAPTQAQPSSLS